MKNDSPTKFNIYTIEEWQSRFGRKDASDDIPPCVLGDVPAVLRPIVKFANRWSIRCDASRQAFFNSEGEGAVVGFFEEVNPYKDKIKKWLDSMPQDTGEWNESAINFLFLLKALSEAYQPSIEEIKEIEARSSRRKLVSEQQKLDFRNALKAYREQNYMKCRSLLSKYEGDLEGEILNKYHKCKELA